MTDDPDPAEAGGVEAGGSEAIEAEAPELPDAFCAEGRLLVAGFDAQHDHVVALDSLCRIAMNVLVGEGVTQGRVDLHLIDLDTISELNAEHMDASGPTDVLSFPLEDDPFALPNDEPNIIGDIVLCPAVAIAQAEEHTGSIDAEFALLVVHGVLHLLGHDHAEPDETLVMQARERQYLAGLGLDHPVPAEPAAPPKS